MRRATDQRWMERIRADGLLIAASTPTCCVDSITSRIVTALNSPRASRVTCPKLERTPEFVVHLIRRSTTSTRKASARTKFLHSLVMLCGDKITVDTSEAYSTRGRIRIHVNRKYHVERILPEQDVAFAGGGLEANTVDGGCSMMAYGLDMRTVELTVV